MNPPTPTTINQPTLAPSRKVSAAGVSGAAVTVVVWAAQAALHIEIPAVVAAALVLIASFGVAYLVPSSTTDTGS
jgi:hypothetical protein